MKVVFDTNVLFAAFATHGLCEAVMSACLVEHEIALSEAILDELRKHLAGKLKLPPEQIEEIEAYLRDHCELVTPAKVSANACRDPADRSILGTAAAAQASYLITGDNDLLTLDRYGETAIVSPRRFYDAMLQKGTQ